MAPTIVELAGAPAIPGIDGRSLVPLVTRTPADWRSSFLVEYTTDIVFPRTLKMGYDGVRTERYKYIRYRDLKDMNEPYDMNELYDLVEDPFELSNLIAAPTANPVRRAMERELDRILASARAPLP